MTDDEAEKLNRLFAVGLSLRSFSVYTTDKTYEKRIVRIDDGNYKSDEDKLTFKVVKLDGFGLFCNWDDVELFENGAVNTEALESSPAQYIT